MADINTTLDALRNIFAAVDAANDDDLNALDPRMSEQHAAAARCAQEIAASAGLIKARYLAVPANADAYYARLLSKH